MEVNGINPHSAIARQIANSTPPNEDPEQTEQTGEATEPPQTAAEPVEEQDDGGEGKGVLRLLQEEHFKGVADVRLRINFFDKLMALQTAQVQAAAAEKAPEAASDVAAVVDSFTAENELSEQQLADIEQLKAQFEQAATEPAEDPVAAITSAFQAFVEALQNLFAQVVEAQQPEEEPAGEPSGEQIGAGSTEESEPTPEANEGPDWQGFIENLQAAFSAALQELESDLSSVAALPPLSEPSGNGVAYEKFLTIYNQMLGIEPAPEESTGELA